MGKMSLVRESYKTVTTPFGERGEFYDEYGHRGTDYRRAGGLPVYAYAKGVVGYVGVSRNLGGMVGMKIHDTAHYVGWAHVRPLVANGQRVEAGDVIGIVAADNLAGWAGVLWDGAHIHTTLSGISSEAAATGARPLRDPAPLISMYIKQAIKPVKTPSEDYDMAKNIGVYIVKGTKYDPDPLKRSCAIFNTESGFLTTFGEASIDYYNSMAAAFGTGEFGVMSEKHFADLKEQLAEVREGRA